MDFVADFVLVSGLGREAALDETFSWMRVVLARHAALEAARAKTAAIATLHATATAFGGKDAHHGFNGFLSQMDAVIAAGPSGTSGPSTPAPEELSTFALIEARARAPHPARHLPSSEVRP